MNPDSTRRQFLYLAGVASTAGLAGYTTINTDDENGQNETSPSEDSEFNDADVVFMRMMIMHHEDAILMAELIPERTDRQELLDLRTEIIETQEAEIDRMCDLLDEADVDGCDMVGGMSPGEMKDMMPDDEMEDMMTREEMEDMMPHGSGEHVMTHHEKRELRRAESQAFDCLFAEHMTRHHEGAVMMAENIREAGESQHVNDLAENIITTQQEEIEMMEGWHDKWDC